MIRGDTRSVTGGYRGISVIQGAPEVEESDIGCTAHQSLTEETSNDRAVRNGHRLQRGLVVLPYGLSLRKARVGPSKSAIEMTTVVSLHRTGYQIEH